MQQSSYLPPSIDVHENIQPVIQKETVQPSVVHTTQPIHEVHHNEAKHHGTHTLPAVSRSEFEKNGGALGGGETRHDKFAGEPKGHVHEPTIGGAGAKGTTHLTDKDGSGVPHNHSHGAAGVAGTTGAAGTHGHETGTKKPSLMDKLNPKKDADGDGKAGFMD